MQAEICEQKDPIPKGYKTYTLFLIPSSEWSTKRQDISEEKLWNNFYDFGRAIGLNNLSVWFVESTKYYSYEDIDANGTTKQIPLADVYRKIQHIKGFNTDIIRCKEYCDKFKLDYNEGPFVVITEKHPDECTEKDIDVVKFNNNSPNKVIRFLNEVERKIRTGKPRKGVSRFTYVSETLSTWLSEHKEDIIKLASAIKG